MLIDSHAHLNFPELLSDIDGVLARAKEAEIEKIINIGTSLADSKIAIELAQKYDNIYATVGIHPNDDTSSTIDNVDWVELESLAKNPKVVAIGECGLDFSRIQYSVSSIEYAQEKERQRELFKKQIEIAQELDLPLSIHIRDAQEDLMKTDLSGLRGAFHCFSGDQKYLDFILGKLPNFYISFAGNLTFKNAQQLRDLAKLVPLDKLLVETDCPFLTPEPHRGSRNEPANVRITAQRLAELHNISLEELEKITTKNTEKLFGI